jgi:hypothetical protein
MTEDYCRICKKKSEGQAVYYFPKLHSTHEYAAFAGVVHVTCLMHHKKSNHIKDVLIDALKSSISEDAGNPILAQEGRVLIQDKKFDECINIYDFEDFADFYVPYWQIDALLELNPNEKIDLGVNKLVTLEVNGDGSLSITANRPYNRLHLKCLQYEKFKQLIRLAKANTISQKSNADDMMEKWKAWTNG